MHSFNIYKTPRTNNAKKKATTPMVNQKYNSFSFWGCGGTGRHAWLRTKCRKVWGFDSLRPYQYNKIMKKFVLGFFIFISLSSFIFIISYLNPGVSLPILPSANAEIKKQENLSWFSRAALDFYFDINILRKADAGYVAIFAKNGRIIHATAKVWLILIIVFPCKLIQDLGLLL